MAEEDCSAELINREIEAELGIWLALFAGRCETTEGCVPLEACAVVKVLLKVCQRIAREILNAVSCNYGDRGVVWKVRGQGDRLVIGGMADVRSELRRAIE